MRRSVKPPAVVLCLRKSSSNGARAGAVCPRVCPLPCGTGHHNALVCGEAVPAIVPVSAQGRDRRHRRVRMSGSGSKEKGRASGRDVGRSARAEMHVMRQRGMRSMNFARGPLRACHRPLEGRNLCRTDEPSSKAWFGTRGRPTTDGCRTLASDWSTSPRKSRPASGHSLVVAGQPPRTGRIHTSPRSPRSVS